MREQKIRHQRLVRLSLGRQRQLDEDGNQIEQEKPEIWEVVLDEHKPEEVWDERLEVSRLSAGKGSGRAGDKVERYRQRTCEAGCRGTRRVEEVL
jgi:hypothetical protein